MLLGISTASLNGKLNTEDALKWIGDIGADCVEIFLTTYSEYRPRFAETLLKAKQSSGVTVSSMHTLNTQFEGQLFSYGKRQKDDAFEIFTDVLDIGKEMGAKNYVLHGPAQIKYTKYNTDYNRFAAVTDELDYLCEERNMRLTWENVHWAHYNHPDFINRLKAKAKRRVHTTLDIKQAMQSGVDYSLYMDNMRDHLVNVHLCDFDSEGMLYLPLEGGFDFEGLFAKMKKQCPDASIVIEVYDRSFTSLDQLKRCYFNLKDILNAI